MKTIRNSILALLLLIVFARGEAALTVLAAASLTDVLQEIKTLYEESFTNTVQYSFASSGALARQIDGGEAVDVFVSADKQWIDFLSEHQRLIDGSVVELLGNDLVLIAPANRSFTLALGEDADLPAAISSGWLAVGDYESVPVGKYAKEALEYYGWFDALKPHLALGDDTRRVLMYVAQGEADAGIVYSTDAAVSDAVVTVAVFPEASHRPIRYYAAVCSTATDPEDAAGFIEYLKSEKAKAVFSKAGFIPLTD